MSLVLNVSAPSPGATAYETVASMEIRCLDAPGDDSRKTDGKLHIYSVIVGGRTVGQVNHCYNDGKWSLIMKAVALTQYVEKH